jgi:hypothetical protein
MSEGAEFKKNGRKRKRDRLWAFPCPRKFALVTESEMLGIENIIVLRGTKRVTVVRVIEIELPAWQDRLSLQLHCLQRSHWVMGERVASGDDFATLDKSIQFSHMIMSFMRRGETEKS